MSVAQTSVDLLSRLGSKGPDISALTQLSQGKPDVDFDEILAQHKAESKKKPEPSDNSRRDEGNVKAREDKPEEKVTAKEAHKTDTEASNEDDVENRELDNNKQETSSKQDQDGEKREAQEKDDAPQAKTAKESDAQGSPEEESEALTHSEQTTSAPAAVAEGASETAAELDASLAQLGGLGAEVVAAVRPEAKPLPEQATMGLGALGTARQTPLSTDKTVGLGVLPAAAKADPTTRLGAAPIAGTKPVDVNELLPKADPTSLAPQVSQLGGTPISLRGTGSQTELLPQKANSPVGLGALLPSTAGLPPLDPPGEAGALSPTSGLAAEDALPQGLKPEELRSARGGLSEGAADNKAAADAGPKTMAPKAGPMAAATALNSAANDLVAQASASKEGPASTSSSTAIEGPRIAGATMSQFQTGAAKGATVQTQVQTPVGQPQWGSAVANKVLWMAAQNLTSAEIHLDPPELGPMMVRVTVSQEQASVTFASQHVAVRDALDQNAFRLREQFEGEGLDLVNVDVGEHNLDQQGESQEEGADASMAAESGAEQDNDATLPVAASKGLVDYFV